MPNPVAGGTIGRTDQGVDISGSPGAALTDPVPGTSKLVGKIANWFRGQPLYVWAVTSGPFSGKYWYVAEQADVTATQASQGQAIGKYAGSGTATEWGWAAGPSGETLARATTGYTEGQVTPAGSDFRSRIIDAPAGPGGTPGTPAKVNAWRVTASQESDGGQGACGAIGSGGMWYSELSTVPMGTGSDFAALGKLPCGTVLNIQNPANGKTVTAQKRDVGAGSSFLPVMGIYPATAAALGLSGGQYTLVIWRQDGGPLHPVRGTPTSASGNFGGTRPSTSGPTNQQPADTGAAVEAVFQAYQDELNAPRVAPLSGFVSLGKAGWAAPFQWWYQSFLGKWQAENTPQPTAAAAASSPSSSGSTTPGTPSSPTPSSPSSPTPSSPNSSTPGNTSRRHRSSRLPFTGSRHVDIAPTPAPPAGTSAWNNWFNQNFNREWTVLTSAVSSGNLDPLYNEPPASNEGALAAFKRFFGVQG